MIQEANVGERDVLALMMKMRQGIQSLERYVTARISCALSLTLLYANRKTKSSSSPHLRRLKSSIVKKLSGFKLSSSTRKSSLDGITQFQEHASIISNKGTRQGLFQILRSKVPTVQPHQHSVTLQKMLREQARWSYCLRHNQLALVPPRADGA
jgi:hypothetical protein